MKLSPHPANFSVPKCRLATLAVILGQKKGGFAVFLSQSSAKVSVSVFLRQYGPKLRGHYRIGAVENRIGYQRV